MLKKDFTSTPATYPVCIHSDCPLAATCLHQMAYVEKVKTDEHLRLINPTLCAKDASCKYHRDCTPVRYARGFTNFQKRMYPDQYSDFMAICVAHWPILRAPSRRPSAVAKRTAIHSQNAQTGWRNRRFRVRQLRTNHQLVRLIHHPAPLTRSNTSTVLE